MLFKIQMSFALQSDLYDLTRRQERFNKNTSQIHAQLGGGGGVVGVMDNNNPIP